MLKIGDILVAKRNASKPIKSGDGVLGVFTIKKGEKYKIIEINKTMKQFCIKYREHELWFSIEEGGFFTEPYTLYFDEKAYKLNKKIKKIL